MKPTKLDKLLASLDACQAARDWVAKEKHRTLSAAWAVCRRGEWMLWLAGKLSGAHGRKRLVLAACECARLSLKHTKDPRVLACIETAEAWANGKATIEQVREARRNCAAAYAYAADAAYAVAYAADYAAAYAYAADAAAAYGDAAARSKALAQCADIVRKHYPKPPRAS